jgi:hypothetical protein
MRFAELDRDKLTMRQSVEGKRVSTVYCRRTVPASICAAIARRATTYLSRTTATASLAAHAFNDPLFQRDIGVLRIASVGKGISHKRGTRR